MLTRMLDTDMAIYVMRGRARGLLGKFNAFAAELCISAITLGELHHGVERSQQVARNLEALRRFVAGLVVLPFDERAAQHHGQIWAELETAGQVCGAHDMQIGGHARSQGLIVVTNNTREFQRMPGVRVENWVAGG
jgi:tRNA(fMet)-specific endonuclease VapC